MAKIPWEVNKEGSKDGSCTAELLLLFSTCLHARHLDLLTHTCGDPLKDKLVFPMKKQPPQCNNGRKASNKHAVGSFVP